MRYDELLKAHPGHSHALEVDLKGDVGISPPCKRLHAAKGGVVKYDTPDGQTVTAQVQAAAYLDAEAVKIHKDGTTARGLTALWQQE